MRRLSLVLAVCWALTPLAAVGAENMLSNSDFDTNISSGWVNPYGRTAEWDERDVHGSPSSGSALLTNDFSNGSAGILSQCVEVTPGSVYHFWGDLFLPAGQTGTGRGEMRVVLWTGDGCSGDYLPSIWSTSATQLDAWTEVAGIFMPPPGYGWAELWLAVKKYEPGDTASFSVHFDDLAMILDSAASFYDGFELGNTDAWSETVP